MVEENTQIEDEQDILLDEFDRDSQAESSDSTPLRRELSKVPMFQRLFQQAVAQVEPDSAVLADFATYVVGPLSQHFALSAAKGGAFFRKKEEENAPNAERYSRDQTLRAHLINGMLPAQRIANLLYQWGAEPMRDWDEVTERVFIAGFMLHDFTKIKAAKAALKGKGFQEMEAPSERQIPVLRDIFRDWGSQLDLSDFLASVGGLEMWLDDLLYVALNTQQKYGTAHAPLLLPNTALDSGRRELAATLSWLADLLAYTARTPRDLVAAAEEQAVGLGKALTQLTSNLHPTPHRAARLVYHHVAENRGLLLNFIHNAALEALKIDDQRVPLLFAPSGVVYLERAGAPEMPPLKQLVTAGVETVRSRAAEAIAAQGKGAKLSKDGLRVDASYNSLFDLREFILISPQLLALVRRNAPQYIEKLKDLGYPHSEDLPAHSTQPTDTRLRMIAEWASLIEIQLESRLITQVDRYIAWLLETFGIADLGEQFEAVRHYKPPREGTGIRYHWYWAALHILARQAGISDSAVRRWLEDIAEKLAQALPSDLPEPAQVEETIWRELMDYLARVLTTSSQGSDAIFGSDLDYYTRAKAGRGGAACAICGDAYTTRKVAETAVAFQPGVYSGRIRMGASDNKRSLCSICALEQLLRQLFISNQEIGSRAEGLRPRYLSFYPSYFFTPETLRFMYEAYNGLDTIRLSDKDLRQALNREAVQASKTGHVPFTDANFWQQLDAFLIRSTDAEPSRRVLRYSQAAQSTFLMIGLRHYDATDTESWVLPAWLALVLAICLDVKVVASESGMPLLTESDDLRETVWFDGAHAATQTLVGTDRIDIDQIASALARLTAAYLIHLDTEYEPPKENWQRFSPIARDLMESPLYVFHYLKKQERDDHPISLDQIRRYIAFAEQLFTQERGLTMSLVRTLVEQYRGFYRAKTPLNPNRMRRPLDVVADALLKADQRVFKTPEALEEVAYAELKRFMDRVGKGLADGRFPKGISAPERDAAMWTFCRTFVNDVFLNIFKGDVAALRGKQLNLINSTAEALYRQMQLEEWAQRGREADESDDESEEI
jgi:CRISPR-associated protein Csc3